MTKVLDLDDVKEIVFSGGELHLSLTKEQIFVPIAVCAKLRSSQDVMKLILITNILKQHRNIDNMPLYLPYFPYARQDRVANDGEPLSAKVMADLVNNLGYAETHVIDPHSDVTLAVLDKVVNCLNIESLLNKVVENYTDKVVIAPDAGAYKKLSKIIKKVPVIQCTKHRDTATGKLSNLQIHSDIDLTGKELLVVDDICDGGGTFIMLAEELKKQGYGNPVSLYVSHGIFSKGLDVLKPHFNKVYTTDSFYKGESDDFVHVEKLLENA